MKKTILFLAVLGCALAGGPGFLSAQGGGPPGWDEDGGQDEMGEQYGPGGRYEEGDGEEREGGPPSRGGGDYGAPPGKRGGMPVYKDCVARAEKYLTKKQYSSAMREFTKSLVSLNGEDPRKVYVYERLGWLNLKLKDLDGAQGYYLTATYQAEKMELFNKYAVNAYRGAAYCFEKAGDIPSAAENYEKALKIATDKAVKRELRKELRRLKPAPKKAAKKLQRTSAR
ncbi:MAG: hypothetical protein COT18_06865 [Elusimicrobia bacterium CG08_land_8_20_14_0_20_59_10]|nr:MAG: hypothetical protein COT18_06865 [Elusimicrobia bacterium CG08_land_8_20_14_0_20_59_10]